MLLMLLQPQIQNMALYGLLGRELTVAARVSTNRKRKRFLATEGICLGTLAYEDFEKIFLRNKDVKENGKWG